jgi:signal transduction histidine kinase/DNA-binding response OmpR family regulator
MTPSPEPGADERVLVLMPSQRDAERTAALFKEENIAHKVCRDLSELCRALRAGAAALLLTDEVLGNDSAGQLSEALRYQPTWSSLPILVLAREGWSREEERLAPSQSSLVMVERPVRTRTLIGVVRSALRDRRHQYQVRDVLLVRQEQAAQLIAQDEKLRFALVAGGLGSWDLNLDTLEMDTSDICKANFGRSPLEPFTYQQLRDCIHPLDQDRVGEAIELCVRGGVDYDTEYRVIWPNGELHWVMVRGRATHDSTGRARRMAGVSLDVTERKRMHEALQQSESELARQAEELRRTDRRKDEFLATLAHELRNPLAPIRTGIDLLARSPSDATEQTLGVMQRQIGHMVRLIDDLLDVSRITSGKLQLKRERVTLSAVVEAAMETSRPLIERKKQTLKVRMPEGGLVLDADLTRIAQVIGNLLNNASNYTVSDGLIELTARREGEFAVIDVCDNGCGIPGDRLGDVFEMFSQVNRTLERSHGGLGIGLALVRRLVEMHGGTSSASSAGLGQGSTFTIRLPLAADEVQPAPAPASERLAPRSVSQRILVVDDNEDAAEMLAMVLEQTGYRTRTAYDSRAALAAVADWAPHIVILDIGLPDINGYDVARELRQSERFGGLSLIALTGWGTQDDKQRALDAGFDVHLTKPVDARALRAALAQLDK